MCNWDYLVSFARAVYPIIVDVFNQVRGVKKESADIEADLESFKAFIHGADKEAEDEQDADRREGIKKMVKQLREAAFCMEDVIDEYEISCEEKQPGDPGCAVLPCDAVGFTKTLIPRILLAYKIHDVKSLVCGIKERYGLCSQFSLEQRPYSSRGNQNAAWQNIRLAALHTHEADTEGLEGPRKILKDWLVDGLKELTVITVEGMGGLGKTTLSKQVFDNPDVRKLFDCHAWITVSQSYTVVELLRKLLCKFYEDKKNSPPQNVSTMDRESLIDEVRNYLNGKRYVVVFDDVWNKEFWYDIKLALFDNKEKSRILITTRDKDVAVCCKESCFVHVHKMNPLTEVESLKLFYKKAFQRDFNGCCPEGLENTSLEIVKKCQGFPLAIVVIGGLLANKPKDKGEWERFSQRLRLELEGNSRLISIIKILSLSYDNLPYNLKSCLLYFGMYPEDYEVKSSRLIRQWIAEWFVKYEGRKTLKELAQQYLTELINRSLVQVTSFTIDGKVKTCCVHDSIREMIIRKIKDTGFCQYVGERDQSVSSEIDEHDQLVSSGIIRRLTIATGSNDLSIESSHIRVILFFTNKGLSQDFINRIPANSTPLKVLDFEDARLYHVPENLGNLIYLKYLSFRNTRVKSLPRSIGKLQNLETLDVRQTNVHEMPKEISELRKLCHLLANKISSVQLKDSLGGMTSLQKISMLIIDYDGVVIRELGKLKKLRNLSITEFREAHKNALCSSLNEMRHLEKLFVDTDEDHQVIDLPFMSSLSTLRKLCLSGELTKWPDWIPKLLNLTKLSLMCSNLIYDPLESLKDMPSLLFLSISRRAYQGRALHFQYGGFQKLKELKLEDLHYLSSISIDEGALHSLEKLQLYRIPQLKKIPSGIQHLKKLKVLNMWFMPTEFEQSISLNGGQERWVIQHVPHVTLFSGLV